jgi:hypothetical protein
LKYGQTGSIVKALDIRKKKKKKNFFFSWISFRIWRPQKKIKCAYKATKTYNSQDLRHDKNKKAKITKNLAIIH